MRRAYLANLPDGARSCACVSWACRGTVPASSGGAMRDMATSKATVLRLHRSRRLTSQLSFARSDKRTEIIALVHRSISRSCRPDEDRLDARRHSPICAPGFSLPTRREIDRPLVLGAVLFGIGWGPVGYRPGPALAGSSGFSGSSIRMMSAPRPIST
jgi:uncharacterized membrane protein YedE/YeeE